MKIKKKGFTLAEVLITLGIIGVVVAMTVLNGADCNFQTVCFFFENSLVV